MSLGMIIISVIMTAICASPFVAMYISRNRALKQARVALSVFAADNKCQLTKQELWRSMALGIDGNQQKFLFVKQLQGKTETQLVDLNDMKSCRLLRENRNVSSNRGQYQIIESLQFRFVPRGDAKKEVAVVIFHLDQDLSMNGELLLAERWLSVLEEQIRLRIQAPNKGPVKPLKASA